MDELRQRLQNVELNQSTVSLGLGILVVFIVGLLLYTYFNRLNRPDQPLQIEPITEEEGEITVEGKPLPAGAVEYVVTDGDWLSTIAQQYYDDMTQWEKIYEQNKETIGDNPNYIQVGMRLIIPDAVPTDGIGGPSILKLEETPETGQPTIPAVYTVQPGDDLCQLGARFFEECSVGWEIYACNRDQIANPHLIYPGQTFRLTC